MYLGVPAESGYSVTYFSTSVCGIKESFVDILCTYTYPSARRIKEAFWHEWKHDMDLSLDPRYQGRVRYLGDKVSNCTLRISDLKENDTAETYQFRFLTDDPNGKFSGSLVSLSLTG